MTDPLLSLLGLARRAGKLSLGCDPVIDSVRNKKSKLVLLSSDISYNTYKKIIRACNEYNLTFKKLPVSMTNLSNALGKHVGVVSVEDNGFSKKVLSVCSVLHEEEDIL